MPASGGNHPENHLEMVGPMEMAVDSPTGFSKIHYCCPTWCHRQNLCEMLRPAAKYRIRLGEFVSRNPLPETSLYQNST
jgi:hypothetical protein